MDLKKAFGKRIKELRLERGFSQETLSHMTELDRTYIPSIEKGERNVSLEVIKKLAKAFDLKIDELLRGIDK